MAIQCTGMRLLACFPVKDLQIFMIFKGRPREEAQGSPRRPKVHQKVIHEKVIHEKVIHEKVIHQKLIHQKVIQQKVIQ